MLLFTVYQWSDVSHVFLCISINDYCCRYFANIFIINGTALVTGLVQYDMTSCR